MQVEGNTVIKVVIVKQCTKLCLPAVWHALSVVPVSTMEQRRGRGVPSSKYTQAHSLATSLE